MTTDEQIIERLVRAAHPARADEILRDRPISYQMTQSFLAMYREMRLIEGAQTDAMREIMTIVRKQFQGAMEPER